MTEKAEPIATAGIKIEKSNASAAPDGEGAVSGGFAVLMQIVLIVAGLGMIYQGAILTPDSAIHQIYQLNAIACGLLLLGVSGIWAAIDAVKRSIDKMRKP